MKKALLKKSLLFGKIFFGLILVLVIVVSVFPLIPPFKNYYHSRTVLTGSMEPKIPKGSVVVNQWADQKNLKVGDVITYQHSADKKIIYITHRIVTIDKTGLLWRFETKGDANPASDFGLVTQAGTEGKVIFMIPIIGYLIEFFKTPVGFILLVALPLLIFIVRQVRDVLKMWKKRDTLPAPVVDTKPKRRKSAKRKARKALVAILLAFSFLAARVSFVTYASFTSGQATITSVTLSTAASFEPSPQPGDVVINEVYYDVDSAHQGAGTENHNEWIELYNTGPGAVDIFGWIIEDNGPAASTDVIPSTPPIPADTFVVITPDSSTWGYWPSIPSGAVKIVLTSTDKKIGNGLNNQGDRVILKDSGGNIIDAMSYGNDNSVWDPDCPDVATGHSLARSPKGYDTNQPSDFVNNPAPNPGTNPHPSEENQSVLIEEPLEPSATPTPSPTPTTEPTPSPSPTPETSPTPTPTAEPLPTPVPSTTPSPEPSPEVSPTPTPEPTPTLIPTESPTSELLTSGNE